MLFNTVSAEPTIGISADTVLDIDDGSISMCMIVASGQYFSKLLVVRSSKRTPIPNIRSALLGGFANSKVLDTHAKRILDNNFKPGFKTKLHAKDLRIVKNLANKKNLKLPGTNLANKNMKKCNQDGHSEKDSSSYYYIVKKQNK